MNAEQIKKAIFDKKTRPVEPADTAEIYGIEGWLFRTTSYQMEDWRAWSNASKPDGSPDEEKRRLGPAKLIQLSFRDKEGNQVFEELDVAIIGGMPDAEINSIFKRCLAINGYGGEGIEAILKNLLAIVGVDGVYASLANINAPCPNCGKDTPNTSSGSNGSASNTGPQEGRRKSTEPSSPEKSPDKS